MRYPDKKSYLHHTERITSFLNRNKDKDPASLVGLIAYFTGCPIIVVCQLVQDIKGESSSLSDTIHYIVNYYHYE